jgi:cob(I)alamin adenosyltransferase
MKIYTGIGDEGKTTFYGCGLVSKDDPRIEAFGAFDELNSVIGLTICYVENEKVKLLLNKIQNDLFQLGADLVSTKISGNVPRITKEHIDELEKEIDILQEKLGMPDKFIFPGGTKSSAFLHLSRVITRRAERTLVRVQGVLDINKEMLKYVNRLSDFLYVLARDANKEVNFKEQQPMYKFIDGNS